MEKAYVYTPIGVIDTYDKPEGFTCGEKTGIVLAEERVIKSCLTRVIITGKDGSEEIIEPVVIESCMNPKRKTIMPITVVFSDRSKEGYTAQISNGYKTVRVHLDDDDTEVRTEKFVPVIKKADCARCHNCGRC